MGKKKETRGRKALPKSKLRTEVIKLLVTKAEKRAFNRAAGETPVATWLRNLGNEAADQEYRA